MEYSGYLNIAENFNFRMLMTYGIKFRNAFYVCCILRKYNVNSISVHKNLTG